MKIYRKEGIRSLVSQNREQDGGISGTIYLQGNRGRRLLFHATGVTRFHEREGEREREVEGYTIARRSFSDSD